MRIRTGFVVFCLLAGATALAAPQAPKTARSPDPEMIDLQGYQKLLEQYHGKPLLVNFWATWCEPCRDEYPLLNELANGVFWRATSRYFQTTGKRQARRWSLDNSDKRCFRAGADRFP